MTNPTPDEEREERRQLITAITLASKESANAGERASNLVTAVQEETAARDRKVAALVDQTEALTEQTNALHQTAKTLKRVIVGLALALAILLCLAGLNFYNTSQTAGVARNAQATNELLLSCLQPNTECSNANEAAAQKLNTDQRQTALVIAFCQRANPAPANSPQQVLACVQGFYPGLVLPPETK